MQRPVTLINYKWTNQEIMNFSYTITINLLNAIINTSLYL